MGKSYKYSFSNIASTTRSRSKFDLSCRVLTSFNAGELIPLKCFFVKPGDIIKSQPQFVIRVSSSFLKPVMDNVFMDVWAFFVPYRLIWEDFEKFITGGTSPSSYQKPFTGVYPSIKQSAATRIPVGSVGDYLGLPTNIDIGRLDNGDTSINVLPFRAYALIYEQWFRNQNVSDEILIQKGSFSSTELPNSSPASPTNYTGKPFKVSKLNDYFTSSLPSPQKGPGVDVPLLPADLPVTTSGSGFVLPSAPLQWTRVGQDAFPAEGLLHLTPAIDTDIVADTGVEASESAATGELDLAPSNLIARFGGVNTTGISVSDMRFAFQYQKLLERSARSGSRYTEYLQAGFGVTPKDATLQRAEFLGGRRIPIHVQQVAQTSQPTSESPLGAVGAYSLSNGSARFTKGFDEHGVVLWLGAIRQYHSYQQGINRNWLVSTRQQEYDPVFANISEQPVYTREIFANAPPSQIFGYNEPFAYLRYEPNLITGQMRSGVDNSMDIWHFADVYKNPPVISEEFNNETDQFVNRTLSVSSSQLNQFIVDCYFRTSAYRVMPLYGTPGLIDHH